MRLYKNGFIVAEMKSSEYCSYNAWPLKDYCNDCIALNLTEEADNRWFSKYDMQEIIPDLDYIKRYKEYCDKINLDTKILLIESPNECTNININIEIDEFLGYDCIGNIYYSYLYTDFKINNGINLNKYGLFDNIDDVLELIRLRQKDYSDVDIEYYWNELPVRISVLNIDYINKILKLEE